MLKGVKAIGSYVGRSGNTIYKWQQELNFPMFLVGGVWEAEQKDIDDWKEHQKNGEWYKRKDKVEKKPRKSRSRTTK